MRGGQRVEKNLDPDLFGVCQWHSKGSTGNWCVSSEHRRRAARIVGHDPDFGLHLDHDRWGVT